MEGVTDVPFRKIIRKHGCGVTCTQMIHAEGLLRGTERRIREISALDPGEHPVGMQLCGHDPGMVSEASRKAEDMGAAFIDINMGCPAKNIVKLGAGAALLREPELAAQIARAAVRSVRIPVTVKIRAGWDEQYRNAVEIGEVLQREGVALLSVHARTKAQKFQGRADWDLIRDLKEHITIPVVGNGDVFSYSDFERMRQTTGADGVMVARGALGNPWIFSGVRPTVTEIQKTLLEHLDLHLSFYSNPAAALVTFRKHIVWYTKGLADAAEFRLRVFKERSHEVILRMIHQFFDRFDPASYPAQSDAC